MNSNKAIFRDAVLILLGAVIGLATGLVTASVTQKWTFEERAELIANNIRGNVLYELENNDALKKVLNEVISKNKNAKINGLDWKHNDFLITAVGNEVGFLKSDAIKKYAHYVGMLKQLQNARDKLINKKIEISDDKGKITNTRFYLGCIDILDKAGKDLLDSLDRYYPEKKQ